MSLTGNNFLRCILKVYLGRVVRDIQRRIEGNNTHQTIFKDLLEKSERLLTQTKDSNTIHQK